MCICVMQWLHAVTGQYVYCVRIPQGHFGVKVAVVGLPPGP